MDGLFVPNISIGLPVLSCIRKVTDYAAGSRFLKDASAASPAQPVPSALYYTVRRSPCQSGPAVDFLLRLYYY